MNSIFSSTKVANCTTENKPSIKMAQQTMTYHQTVLQNQTMQHMTQHATQSKPLYELVQCKSSKYTTFVYVGNQNMKKTQRINFHWFDLDQYKKYPKFHAQLSERKTFTLKVCREIAYQFIRFVEQGKTFIEERSRCSGRISPGETFKDIIVELDRLIAAFELDAFHPFVKYFVKDFVYDKCFAHKGTMQKMGGTSRVYVQILADVRKMTSSQPTNQSDKELKRTHRLCARDVGLYVEHVNSEIKHGIQSLIRLNGYMKHFDKSQSMRDVIYNMWLIKKTKNGVDLYEYKKLSGDVVVECPDTFVTEQIAEFMSIYSEYTEWVRPKIDDDDTLKELAKLDESIAKLRSVKTD